MLYNDEDTEFASAATLQVIMGKKNHCGRIMFFILEGFLLHMDARSEVDYNEPLWEIKLS